MSIKTEHKKKTPTLITSIALFYGGVWGAGALYSSGVNHAVVWAFLSILSGFVLFFLATTKSNKVDSQLYRETYFLVVGALSGVTLFLICNYYFSFLVSPKQDAQFSLLMSDPGYSSLMISMFSQKVSAAILLVSGTALIFALRRSPIKQVSSKAVYLSTLALVASVFVLFFTIVYFIEEENRINSIIALISVFFACSLILRNKYIKSKSNIYTNAASISLFLISSVYMSFALVEQTALAFKIKNTNSELEFCSINKNLIFIDREALCWSVDKAKEIGVSESSEGALAIRAANGNLYALMSIYNNLDINLEEAKKPTSVSENYARLYAIGYQNHLKDKLKWIDSKHKDYISIFTKEETSDEINEKILLLSDVIKYPTILQKIETEGSAEINTLIDSDLYLKRIKYIAYSDGHVFPKASGGYVYKIGSVDVFSFDSDGEMSKKYPSLLGDDVVKINQYYLSK